MFDDVVGPVGVFGIGAVDEPLYVPFVTVGSANCGHALDEEAFFIVPLPPLGCERAYALDFVVFE